MENDKKIKKPVIAFLRNIDLPVIALLLNFLPVSIMLLMGLHLLTDNYIISYFSLVLALIWMGTGFGALFHIAGIIVAIYYLYSRKKQTTTKGVILSLVSILFPFVLWYILIVFEIADFGMLP